MCTQAHRTIAHFSMCAGHIACVRVFFAEVDVLSSDIIVFHIVHEFVRSTIVAVEYEKAFAAWSIAIETVSMMYLMADRHMKLIPQISI